MKKWRCCDTEHGRLWQPKPSRSRGGALSKKRTTLLLPPVGRIIIACMLRRTIHMVWYDTIRYDIVPYDTLPYLLIIFFGISLLAAAECRAPALCVNESSAVLLLLRSLLLLPRCRLLITSYCFFLLLSWWMMGSNIITLLHTILKVLRYGTGILPCAAARLRVTHRITLR